MSNEPTPIEAIPGMTTVDWERGATQAVWDELDASRKRVAGLEAFARYVESHFDESYREGSLERMMGDMARKVLGK